MSEYWLGVLTPFALICGLAIACGLAYALFRLGDWLNEKTHGHFAEKITVQKNLADPFRTKPKRPEYLDQANKFRDALLRSPRMLLFRAFGLLVIVIRDYREAPDDR